MLSSGVCAPCRVLKALTERFRRQRNRRQRAEDGVRRVQARVLHLNQPQLARMRLCRISLGLGAGGGGRLGRLADDPDVLRRVGPASSTGIPRLPYGDPRTLARSEL